MLEASGYAVAGRPSGSEAMVGPDAVCIAEAAGIETGAPEAAALVGGQRAAETTSSWRETRA